MNKLKKLLAVSTIVTTFFGLAVTVNPVNAAVASDGDLIKMNGLSSVYFLKGGKRYVFPNEQTYFSWYSDWNGVKTIPQDELYGYPLGGNITIRPGTKLVKITTNPTVYAVEPGGTLRSIVSEANAIDLYGANWAKTVVDVPDSFFTNYTVGNALTAGQYPIGTVVNPQGSSNLFYFDGTNYRQFANDAAFLANNFSFNYVVTTTKTITAGGAQITGAEAALDNVNQGAGTGQTAETGGSGLTVALASDTPAATTYIRDTGELVSQAYAPMAKFNFTASSDGQVKVTTLKLNRSGISADTDLGTVYLYDGDTQIAEQTSISSKVITFTNSAGLFIVPAGTTKAITVKMTVANGATTISSIVLGINAATDVVTATGTVTGTFPMNGNAMGVGTVTDLGYLNIATVNSANFPATMDPGTLNSELFHMSVTANDQNMVLSKLKFTLVGTIATTDVTNFKLMVGGTQIGSTVASMNDAKEVTFDLSSAPYTITSGQTKVMSVYGDVVNGTGRAFKFTIRKVGDITAKDNNYGVYTAPLYNGAAFTLVDPDTSGDGTNINNGTLTVSVASDTPTGNIPTGVTGVSLAKFTMKANGEDIKVNSISITMDKEATDSDLKNGKLYFNGSQVGTTDTYVRDETANVFTLSQIIAAGTTATVEYRADIVHGGTGGDGTGATGAAIPAGQTIKVSLNAGTTYATGQTSLANIANAAANGRTLTVAGNAVTSAKNGALANYSTTSATGVLGATQVKVGSFVLTAGTGEGSTVTQVVLKDAVGSSTVADNFGGNFQNLTLKNGSTLLAPVQGTLSSAASATYTFNLSPAVTIAAGQQYVVDAYADILTGAAGFTTATPGLNFYTASATGVTSGSDTSTDSGNAYDLQNLYITSGGALTVTQDAATPVAQMVVMGTTDIEMARLNFAAGLAEDVTVNRIKLKNTGTGGLSLTNIKLYDASTGLQVGPTLASFTADSNGYAEFNLATPWTITKGSNKSLIIKASVNAYPNATSALTEIIGIALPADLDTYGASSGTGIGETATAVYGRTQTVVHTKLNAARDTASPSGKVGVGTDTTVAIFDFTNTSNVDNQSATVTDLAITFANSGTVANGTGATKLYRDSVNSSNILATKTISNSVPTTIALDGWNSTTITDFSVASGSTVKVFVTTLTTGYATDATLTASIPSANPITWSDGTTEGAALTSIDAGEVLGGTLIF